LALLRFLNPRRKGASLAELVPPYDAAKADYPLLYENYPFDKCLGFLQAFNLVAKQDSRVFITVAGCEFLKYLIAAGKSGPFYG
jgi:hypothetical protein